MSDNTPSTEHTGSKKVHIPTTPHHPTTPLHAHSAQAAARAAAKYLSKEDILSLNPEATGNVVWMPAAAGKRVVATLVDLFLAWVGACLLHGAVTLSVPKMADWATILPLIIVSYWLINGWFLFKHGQSVGKSVAHVRILTLDNKHQTLGRLFFMRFLIPLLIFPVDAFTFFRKDGQCLHDRLARTKVVDATPVQVETLQNGSASSG